MINDLIWIGVVLRAARTTELVRSEIVTSKGQTTIPKKIRDALHMKAGDRISFTRRPTARLCKNAFRSRGCYTRRVGNPYPLRCCRGSARRRHQRPRSAPGARQSGSVLKSALIGRPSPGDARARALRTDCKSNLQSIQNGVEAKSGETIGSEPFVRSGVQVVPWDACRGAAISLPNP